MAKVRTWTDGSGAYTVEAQLLRLDPDGQVLLHKTNGKKISVALAKFSPEDRRYVEGVTGTGAPEMPAKPMTARQRQQESARKHPERRPVNYDWDWFDFFTLKGGVSADSALKYATSFVAERLDDQSIPDITSDTLRTLGVKPADIAKLERAFRVHQGLPVADTTNSLTEGLFASPSLSQQEPKRVLSSPSWAQQPSRSPVVSSPKPDAEPSSPAQPRRAASNNPWGIDSELDRRVDRKKQIESDEALARRLQQEEQQQGKKPSSTRKQHGASRARAPDPFTSLDMPANTLSAPASSTRPTGLQPAARNTPLNLAAGSRRPAKSQVSVVDPAQLRSAQQKLSGPTSPVPVPDSTVANSGPGAFGTSALDQAFGSGGAAAKPSQAEHAQHPPPRSRPTVVRQQSALSASMTPLAPAPSMSAPPQSQQQQANFSGMGELTTQRMAVAAATGNTAQIDRLEQMAIAKAQELAAQEARIKQQQEEIRKQAMFLHQQQQQLLQMQQTQKVEAQLKQLKEDKERLEAQRQAEAMKQQVEMLKAQQEQMLRMQQMATQARGLQTASASAVQAPLSAPVSMTPGLAQQQQQASMLGANAMGPMPQNMQLQQKSVPLSSRLPPPLVPSRVNKPLTPQSNQVNFSHQQQQQQGQQHPSFAQRQQQQFSTSSALSPVGMFSASHGITNLPAASSSTTGLVPAGMSGGVFSNHAVTGSTPNLGSFTSSKSAMANVGNIGGGFGASSMAPSGFNNGGAATHSVTNFSSYSSGQINQPASQFMPQQQRLLQPSAAMAIGGINASQMSANQAGNKYDLF
ncbi:hypothetical protein GGI04_005176, partial [Coemansia thaxteri]